MTKLEGNRFYLFALHPDEARPQTRYILFLSTSTLTLNASRRRSDDFGRLDLGRSLIFIRIVE